MIYYFYFQVKLCLCKINVNSASATLFRHTAADPVVVFNIFMFQSANKAMGGNAEASEFSLLDTLFKDPRDIG